MRREPRARAGQWHILAFWRAESIEEQGMGFFMPTTVVQPVWAGAGSCGQHAARVTQESSAAGVGVGVGEGAGLGEGVGVGEAAGHWDAQLVCLQVPTAWPAWAQPGAMRELMHCIMLPPPQMQRVKSGQLVPTV